MKTTPVSDHSLQLTGVGIVNCYLVREADGFRLIDTGLPGGANKILAVAARAGGSIRRILLTHAHLDHVGSVDSLAAKLALVDIAASRRSLPLLQQRPDTSLRVGEPKGRIMGIPGIRATVTQVLSAEQRVGSLRVIETPGHLPGHLSFLDERDGTLYAGDAVVGVGGLSVPGYGPWYSLGRLFSWNKELALASSRKLLGYRIARFATGHLGVREGGVATLNASLANVNEANEWSR